MGRIKEREEKRTFLTIISILIVLGIATVSVLIATGIINFKKEIPVTDNVDNTGAEKKDTKNEDVTTNTDKKDTKNEDVTTNTDKKEEVYLFKVKVTNKDGANVYNGYSFYDDSTGDVIVDRLEYGSIIAIYGDEFFSDDDYYFNIFNVSGFKFIDEIKKDYYFEIEPTYKPRSEYRYVKYTDVEVIPSSIVTKNPTGSSASVYRYYIGGKTCLRTGPAVGFECLDVELPVGTIVTSDYSFRGWLYVSYGEYNGWVHHAVSDSANYPYDNITFYTSVYTVSDKKEIISFSKDMQIYKFAVNTKDDTVLTVLPAGTKLSSDYNVDWFEKYYHVNYNGYDGWISVWPYENN